MLCFDKKIIIEWHRHYYIILMKKSNYKLVHLIVIGNSNGVTIYYKYTHHIYQCLLRW